MNKISVQGMVLHSVPKIIMNGFTETTDLHEIWYGRLERELQMVQLSATGCSCIAFLWVSL